MFYVFEHELQNERHRFKRHLDKRHAEIDLEVDVRYKNEVDTLNEHRNRLNHLLDDHQKTISELQSIFLLFYLIGNVRPENRSVRKICSLYLVAW